MFGYEYVFSKHQADKNNQTPSIMTVKNLFTVNGIVCILFAIPLILFPVSFLQNYIVEGDHLGNIGVNVSRAYGGMLLALGVALLMARKAQPSYGRKGLLAAIFIGNLVGFLVYAQATFVGAAGSMTWSSVAITGIFAIWALLLLLKEKID